MPIYIYTPDQVLRIGLKMVGVDCHRQKKQKNSTNLEDFRAHYCVDPIVCAQMWEDLQTTNIQEAHVDAKSVDNLNSGCNLKNFLRAFHFLMRYQTDREKKCSSGHASETIRKWIWYFVVKIGALRGMKIVWPGTWTSNFIISVDGVHCRFHEEKHPTLSKNPKLWSHKFNGPGLAYELALDIFCSKLVWLKGPLEAGNSDRKIYNSELRQKIPAGKKVVTDGGYRNRADPRIAAPNSQDSEELRTFKARARMRQENFNNRLKRFGCLKNSFRHDRDKHGHCFVAVAVICRTWSGTWR